jgi:23S rRNA (cytidine1920-2'-O)/16S rRNA (cytidine1409-2'-O)-methyltransferase
MGRTRLDVLLVQRGLLDSRTRARTAITTGNVTVDGRLATRPAELVDTGADICATPAHPWVSRAALKLIHALDSWPIRVEARIVLDVGASTGGFTEVCLARGARRIYAVDVGRGQLHPRIAADPRVVDLQETDARALDRQLIPDLPDLVVCDASFIGFAKVIPGALALAGSQADLVALVKPQFEVGPHAIGKGGVVRDVAARDRSVQEVKAFLERSGWPVRATMESPVRGTDGNLEYLLWARRA